MERLSYGRGDELSIFCSANNAVGMLMSLIASLIVAAVCSFLVPIPINFKEVSISFCKKGEDVKLKSNSLASTILCVLNSRLELK